jgi:hypothetical protein
MTRNGFKVTRIATGEEPEDYGPDPESEGKDPAAVALGRKGGKARAAALGKRKRAEIARKRVKHILGCANDEGITHPHVSDAT